MKAAMVGLAVVGGLGAFVALVLAVLLFVGSTTVFQQSAALQLCTVSAISFVAMVVALAALTPQEWRQG
jgi:ABC-type branched-subunit amino acid transport system permease subunit